MSDQLNKAYNDHNAYIVGAGFSQEAGLPLIKDFMNRMRDAAAWLDEQSGREGEVEAIRRVLEFRLKAAAAAHRVPINIENVEELFSLASASAGDKLAEDMAQAIAATLDYARNTAPQLAEHQYFPVGMLNVPGWTKPPKWKPPPAYVQQGMQSGQYKGEWFNCPPYDFYVGVMCGYFNKGGQDRRDTIITFNYDTLIEDTLENLGLSPVYGLPNEDTAWGVEVPRTWHNATPIGRGIQVLKLHGSVNWCLPIEEMLQSGDLKEMHPNLLVERWSRLVAVHRDYEKLTNGGYKPFLVPPSWRKEFGARLTPVRDSAVSALRTATNVIILGYSIPPTDQHFKYLLAAGLQDNISLRKVFFVNPALEERETEAQQEFKRQLEDRLFGLFRRELFDQGIIEPVPTDLRGFFTGLSAGGRESYRARMGRPLNPSGYAWDTAPWTFVAPSGASLSIA